MILTVNLVYISDFVYILDFVDFEYLFIDIFILAPLFIFYICTLFYFALQLLHNNFPRGNNKFYLIFELKRQVFMAQNKVNL